MELLLLVTMGVVAWLFNRSEKLERRLAELEGEVYARSPSSVEALEPLAPVRAATPAMPRTAAPEQQPPIQVPMPQPAPTPRAIENAPAEPAYEAIDDDEHIAINWHHWRPSFDFEEIFGRMLPIWGGGIALAIAGFFLVRWSIEMGLLNEYVRVGLGFAFGIALLAAAETAHRFEARLRDERVRQALAGAGLATLYASFYLAGSLYALISPTLAFGGLAAVTALAIALSFRFGLPSAVMGLVGGFAAPALIGSPDPNLPLLATYLALVTGGLMVTGQRQGRSWLGLAALGGSLGWGALMLLAGPLDSAGVLAIGGYLVLVGALLPSIMGAGPLGQIGRIAAAGLATVQIAALVHQSGYSLLAWGCYLLLGTAIAILGTRFARLREAGGVAAALVACLLAAWPAADPAWYAVFAAASALVFAAVPVFHAWRDEAGPVDWAQLALYPIALVAVSCIQLGVPVLASRHTLLALGALALAMLPMLAAWHAWPARDGHFAPGPFAALASAIVLALLGGLLALPDWTAPLVTEHAEAFEGRAQLAPIAKELEDRGQDQPLEAPGVAAIGATDFHLGPRCVAGCIAIVGMAAVPIDLQVHMPPQIVPQ